MTRKRTRRLTWLGSPRPDCRVVLGGGQVLLPLTDVDDTTRPHLLVLSADDAEFMGNQLVSLARIARERAADPTYAAYVESASDEPGWADRTLTP